MVLSGNGIKKAIKHEEFSITPFREENLKSASYTFTLSSLLLVPKNPTLIEITRQQEREQINMGAEGHILNPGDFILGYTQESIALKNKYVCFFKCARFVCAGRTQYFIRFRFCRIRYRRPAHIRDS